MTTPRTDKAWEENNSNGFRRFAEDLERELAATTENYSNTRSELLKAQAGCGELKKDKERLDFMSGGKKNRDRVINAIRTFEANSGCGYNELALNVRVAIDQTIAAKKEI